MINLVSKLPNTCIQAIGLSDYVEHCGMLVTPRSSPPQKAIDLGAKWALDNDCFNGFNPDAIFNTLRRYRDLPLCQFALAPDVVSNAVETLARFAWWHPIISGFGYPVALAIQNGQENYSIPWDKIDAVFIAGDTEFKLGAYAASVVRDARRRGKLAHMGRVNSDRRIQYARAIGCTSFDGTGYSKFTNATLPNSIKSLKSQKQLALF